MVVPSAAGAASSVTFELPSNSNAFTPTVGIDSPRPADGTRASVVTPPSVVGSGGGGGHQSQPSFAGGPASQYSYAHGAGGQSVGLSGNSAGPIPSFAALSTDGVATSGRPSMLVDSIPLQPPSAQSDARPTLPYDPSLMPTLAPPPAAAGSGSLDPHQVAIHVPSANQ